ncbi:16S rRNA (cytosine(1402)-N(4))-methyltransferase RsmH [Cyanobium sp. ATX 6A2]|uniref:16S rRNA (cytosine(1402)-N(4))-methyltransferase RsmH n=1 Tax=Cyanobium sp. ATX 6A2 TaxID=2823700 RepID=UPI0020CDD0D8|nr:16S rRNA (cytosine(1402)-N(4))-methyltransferase RsmH [Cyanobium sp. ATX 6A2]MCP9888031.1 16S rRNA (cytosine(1402)-N(4))-methyltransferase RsmH [Cyanobium sp. ATX 6A2]
MADATTPAITAAAPSPDAAGVFAHRPVLAEPLLAGLAPLAQLLAARPEGGLLIDCTLGGGGHSALLLEAHPGLRVLGLDHDPSARAAAAARLAPFGDRAAVVAANFAAYQPPEPALVVLADLGVSSPQLDVAARGFSFRLAGPLDMRMNPEGGETAGELIDRLPERELADLIYGYGEERLSRRIARRVQEQGPWADPARPRNTAELAYLVAGCYPPAARRGRIHPATRTFQALRIAVNDELGALDRLLQRAPAWLEPGGLLAIISFHSLEDRRVKTAFLGDERLERITRKPLVASAEEAEANPRSRSAKLRIARRRP